MKKSKTALETNPIIIKKHMSIGSGNAETDDEFLFDCFVKTETLDLFLNHQSSAMIVEGRTGSGKTAIFRYIESSAEHSVELDPLDMSMSYVSNSDALRFLQAIGADINLLFQTLWKHVLCIEFIRLRWNVENTAKSRSVFQKIRDSFQNDERKKKSIDYLKKWESKFWITMDENIKEIVSETEKSLAAEFAAEIAGFKAGGGYEKRMKETRKSEIVARSRKIIDTGQLMELGGVIDMLAATDSDKMKRFYILIDKLDENWVDDSIRFKLVGALIESLRAFRKIPNLKILLAIRADIRDRVLRDVDNVTFQREKYDGYAVAITWHKNDLKKLVELRLNKLFKRQYTNESIGFSDIFPDRHGGKNTFDWLIERTLMRPRDIISFVNECLNKAEGKSAINVRHINKAEISYAQKRHDALCQEWLSAYPSLRYVLSFFGNAERKITTFDELLLDKRLGTAIMTILTEDKLDGDPIYKTCDKYMHNEQFGSKLALAAFVSLAYQCGAIGVKLSEGTEYLYSHIDDPLLRDELVGSGAKFRLHPMLWGAFKKTNDIT